MVAAGVGVCGGTHVGRHHQRDVAAGSGGLRGAVPVGREVHSGQTGQRVAPPAHLPVAFRTRQPAALPGGVVGRLDRQRRQVVPATGTVGGIECGQLPGQYPRRPPVRDDVVEDHHQGMVVRGEPGDRGAEGRAGGEVERPGVQLAGPVEDLIVTQLDHRQRRGRGRWLDDLAG